VRLATPLQQERQALLRVIEGDVGRKEAGALRGISLDDLPNAASQDGADQDI
jgi:hypothetical protein